MKRRSFLQSLAGTALAQTGNGRPPNVIFILADDLGWGDLGCYGQREIRTPHLDAMARQGTQFTHFYVNNPVCSPSRTGWMTGQFPARHRVHGHFADAAANAKRDMPNFLDTGTVFLPRLLQKAGYATAHFGKWHLGHGPGAPLPKEYGFSETRTLISNENAYEEERAQPHFWNRSSQTFVDDALRFAEKNRNQPFYMNLWLLVPHAILDPPPEQMQPYARTAPGGPGFAHKGAKQIYYSTVTDMDAQIGRLLGRLDAMGLSGNTLVVFSSDNGPEDIHINNASHSAIGSPGPFRGRKRSLYEGGLRVPLLARWPGRVPARLDDSSVLSGVDFLPTVCRLANVPVPEPARQDGEDRSGVLLGKPSARSKPLYWEWRYHIYGYNVNRSPMLAVRDGGWKLLMNPDRSRVELYDIPRDPAEMTNLAERQPEVVRRLAERALAWQKTLPPGMQDPTAGRNDWPWPKAI